MDDPWGDQLRRESLGEAADKARNEGLATAISNADFDSEVDGVSIIDEGEDGLDGEPLTAEDESMDQETRAAVRCLVQETKEQTHGLLGPTLGEGLGAYSVGCSSGVAWTQMQTSA